MDSVWCGDALFVNRRLDALTLLAAVAGRTERVLLGPACMGSFALRDPMVFAYEWASLDVISNGRTRLVACAGGGAGPLWEAETAAMGINPDDRRKHMVENMHVLRHLWTKDNEPFEGKFVKFSNITLEPKPIQNPCPIWLATNAERLSSGPGGFRRFGVRADARRQDRRWLDDAFGQSRGLPQLLGFHPEGRPRRRPRHVAASITCCTTTSTSTTTRTRALADSKKFLDLYYGANYSKERLEAWLTYGSPRDCIEHLKRFKDARLQPRHVPDFDHGRPDGAAAARHRRGAAVCVSRYCGSNPARSAVSFQVLISVAISVRNSSGVVPAAVVPCCASLATRSGSRSALFTSELIVATCPSASWLGRGGPAIAPPRSRESRPRWGRQIGQLRIADEPAGRQRRRAVPAWGCGHMPSGDSSTSCTSPVATASAAGAPPR